MSKISRISRYFADDKDILDLVSQGSVSLSRLSEVLRRRGVIVSPKAEKQTVATYFQRLQFSWPQLVELLEILDRPERDDKFTNFRIDGDPAQLTVDNVIAALDNVKSERGSRFNEIYKISKINDNSLAISVEYSEPDFSKTRLRQNQDRTVNFTIDTTPSGLQVRHSSGTRGTEVMEHLERFLGKEDQPLPRKREIALSGFSSDKRSRFFVELARGIAGYTLSDQNGLRVDRPESMAEDEEDEQQDGGTDDDAVLEGLVKRAVLQGSSLLSSAEYQGYARRGYSMSKLNWVAEGADPKQGWIEFMAEFQNGPEGTGFKYGILGKWDRKDDGERAKMRRAVTQIEKESLLRLIEDGAYNALDSIADEQIAESESAIEPLT